MRILAHVRAELQRLEAIEATAGALWEDQLARRELLHEVALWVLEDAEDEKMLQVENEARAEHALRAQPHYAEKKQFEHYKKKIGERVR